ncbi:hypothetical protein NY547_12265 [Cnuibacter physcomitrellae]|uniref:hypothetical protein n=1 Tax=Cnuibacter physcomitrellae TaxID=1619308 RepID=UPI002176081A|nr:hypothetical protein [Cnuibacter physcomitrellae]MCS5498015.1 hypothetical protein [Cnuibacter physcomitrellae]
MRAVAIATAAVAVAALVGFAVKAPEQAAVAGSEHGPSVDRSWAGSVTASWQERTVGDVGGWSTSAWVGPLQSVVAADEGFASDQARSALAGAVSGLGDVSALAAPLATTVLAGGEGARHDAEGTLAASLARGAEIKALVATAKASLEQVRLEAVARAQAVLDAETPEADAASREALAAALAVPALAAGAPSLQTPSAVTALVTATRAAQAAQAAAVALQAQEAAESVGGSGGESSDDGPQWVMPCGQARLGDPCFEPQPELMFPPPQDLIDRWDRLEGCQRFNDDWECLD